MLDPGDCWQWGGKHKFIQTGMGKADEITLDQELHLNPNNTRDEEAAETTSGSLHLHSPLQTLEEGKAKAQRHQLTSSPPSAHPSPP